MSDVATAEQREEFWDRLEDCRTGMLGAEGRFMPMTHNLEPEDGNIWFLTAKGTDMAAAADKNEPALYIVCNDQQSLYMTVEGRLEVSTDQAKLDEVWSAMASVWFEEGKQDPDLVLMKLRPTDAEVWLGPKSALKFIWSFAKARLAGEEADFGAHFKIAF